MRGQMEGTDQARRAFYTAALDKLQQLIEH
jgi:hypothetical protein